MSASTERGERLLLAPVAGGAPILDCVHHCDALSLLRALPSGCIDMALTSPPYDNLRRYNGYSFEFEPIAREAYRVLKPGGVLVWVVGDSVVDGSETLTSFRQAIYFKEIGFNVHDTMIWHNPGVKFADPTRYFQKSQYMFVFSKGKPNAVHLLTEPNKTAGADRPKGTMVKKNEPDGRITYRVRVPTKECGVMGNVWTMNTGYMVSTTDLIAFDHPAIFPETLAERHIFSWSNPGDTVLDFFMGSGTTAKMARANGRHYIGCDISSEYVKLARERLRLPFEQHHVVPNNDLTAFPLFAAVTP